MKLKRQKRGGHQQPFIPFISNAGSKNQNLSACNQSGLKLTPLFIAAGSFCLCDFALKMKREKVVYLYLEKLILSTYILPHFCLFSASHFHWGYTIYLCCMVWL